MSSVLLELSRYPVGAPSPCVLSVLVLGDNVERLARCYVEVPVPVDRGLYHRLQLCVELASASGTAGFAAAVKEADIVSATLRHTALMLHEKGYVTAGHVVLESIGKVMP